MLTSVARHDREGERPGGAPRAGLCFQAALCPFPPPSLEQKDPSDALIPALPSLPARQSCFQTTMAQQHGD